mgnify:CR=1 FL=1
MNEQVTQAFRSAAYRNTKRGTVTTRVGHLRYDSSIELAFIEKCAADSDVLSLTRCAHVIQYVDHLGHTRNHHPDFTMTTAAGTCICEVKSIWTVKHPDVALKEAAAREQGHDYRVMLGHKVGNGVEFGPP